MMIPTFYNVHQGDNYLILEYPKTCKKYREPLLFNDLTNEWQMVMQVVAYNMIVKWYLQKQPSVGFLR